MVKLKPIGMLAFIMLLLTACQKDENKEEPSGITPISLEKNQVVLKLDESVTISITSGNGGYTAKVADETKAMATISENSVKIEAKAEGQTTVTVTDIKKQSAQIVVTVRNLALPTELLTLERGATATYTLSFGTDYTLDILKTAVATATISNSVLYITGTEKGETDIVVKDLPTEKTQILKLTVVPPQLELAKTGVVLEGTSVTEVAILRGTPDYTVSTTNEQVAMCEVVGKEQKVVRIRGVGEGTATITVVDAENKTVAIGVKVNAAEESDLFDIDDYGVVTLKESANPKGSIVIPAKGTSIDDELFYSNKAITQVDLNNVTEIGVKAFSGTSFLVKVIMRKVEEIGEDAFNGAGLSELTLPETVKTIGQRAFMGNRSLVKITCMSATPPTLQSQTFAGVWNSSTKTVVLYVPKGAKKAYQTDEHWGKFKEIKELN